MNPADILGGPGDAPKTDAAKTKDEEEQAKEPEYQLLRYFDFDVEPDKHYVYRMFLLLHNPNFGLDANVLEDAEAARDFYLGIDSKSEKKDEKGKIVWVDTNPRYAPWSQPCTSGRGPGDLRLLCGPVTAAKGPQEINAEVRILLWLSKTGRNGNFDTPNLVRGTVLNFDKAAVKVPGEPKTTVPLAPNCILVDLAGGEPLPSPKNVSPGMILVMDESGSLVIHDEAAESDDWDKAITEPARQEPRHSGDQPGHPPSWTKDAHGRRNRPQRSAAEARPLKADHG